jgi:hypothetical protein
MMMTTTYSVHRGLSPDHISFTNSAIWIAFLKT